MNQALRLPVTLLYNRLLNFTIPRKLVKVIKKISLSYHSCGGQAPSLGAPGSESGLTLSRMRFAFPSEQESDRPNCYVTF
ncbi:hypothetical protein F7734_23485 [Scytonema sp. UIC 10036]|uniref:hypothetical protein n=1 Tax=Scytonema sp. UIC 10036 TaxID=2304196 RepID=UPI0012DAC51B|nr:hypothetical protein [Scytonema sp. UIC 10036]MUG95158.1 hypothetical protein [Scytonema sp. UIC 10036]